MSMIKFCVRLALVAYVVALIALYLMQDRMLLPAPLDIPGTPTGHRRPSASRIQTLVFAMGRPMDTPPRTACASSTRHRVE